MTILTFQSSPIIIESLGPWVRSQIVALEELLLNILQGETFPELEALITECTNPLDSSKWIREDVQNRTPGYSFISDERNSFYKYDTALLKRIHENPKLFAKFMIVNSEGQIQVRPSA